MAKIRCRGCGKVIDERETSCPYCGKRTGGSRAALTKKKKSKLPALIAAAVIILILMLAAILILPRIEAGVNSPQIETYDDGSRKESVLNSGGLPESYVIYDAENAETERGEYAYSGTQLLSEHITYADGSSYDADYEDGSVVSEIWYSSDGSRQENEFDRSGNLLSSVIYDGSGTVTGSKEYEYSESGSVIHEKSSNSDGSSEEYEYAEDGTILICVIMNDDGSGYRAEYDENGEIVKETWYYSDGTSEETAADPNL